MAKITGNPDTRAFVRAANITPQQDHRRLVRRMMAPMDLRFPGQLESGPIDVFVQSKWCISDEISLPSPRDGYRVSEQAIA
ncbi:hypothetical protein LP421_00695 (plasmid) [Rhizobium sp. RCAM05350]|nr:hypothetical protein LP421_00695 [Rhizobium sp. RCAM05350]